MSIRILTIERISRPHYKFIESAEYILDNSDLLEVLVSIDKHMNPHRGSATAIGFTPRLYTYISIIYIYVHRIHICIPPLQGSKQYFIS